MFTLLYALQLSPLFYPLTDCLTLLDLLRQQGLPHFHALVQTTRRRSTGDFDVRGIGCRCSQQGVEALIFEFFGEQSMKVKGSDFKEDTR